MIKEVFEEDEVASICQIPISSYNGRDQQIWRCTKKGEFTVRNGDGCEWNRHAHMLVGKVVSEKDMADECSQCSEGIYVEGL
jgi:hypothetical protein